jgi:hypothetical protein
VPILDAEALGSGTGERPEHATACARHVERTAKPPSPPTPS